MVAQSCPKRESTEISFAFVNIGVTFRKRPVKPVFSFGENFVTMLPF